MEQRSVLSGVLVLFGLSGVACDAEEAELTSDTGAFDGGAMSSTEGSGESGMVGSATGDTESTEGTGGAMGECRPYVSLERLVEVMVDGSEQAPLPESTCEVRSVDVADGRTQVTFDCIDGDSGTHVVTMALARAELPAGIAPGAEFGLSRTPDQTSTFGPGHQLRMSDAQGIVLAQVEYSAGTTALGPFELSYGSHCPPVSEETPGQTESGFVHVLAAQTGTAHEAFVGDFVDVQEAGYAWQVHAFYTFALCCHPPVISAAVLRR